MGGKNDGGGSAPAAPNYGPGYIPGSFNPETGMPFKDPNYEDPTAMELPAFHMPDFGAQQTEYADQLAAQQAEAVRNQGLNDRDALYADYMSAAGSATDYINQRVSQEQSNAALLGIDYQLDDAEKATRVSDYFASIWGEGDQARLQGLFDKWGNPEGFAGWTIERGDAGNAAPGTEASEDTQAISEGRKRTLATGIDTADTTLGETTLLGG